MVISETTQSRYYRKRRYAWAACICTILLLSFTSANAQSVSTCSGTPFNYFQPAAPNGTTYTWTAPVILPAAGAITGGSAQAGAQSSVSQVLVNTTTFQATATYTVTPSTGAAFQLIVTVNPLPVLSSSATPAAVCSGANFSYTPTSATPFSGFSWNRLAVNGISNTANQGGGDPNETLINTTINPITVTYTYTVFSNGCSKANQDVAVVVNPTPFLSSTQRPASVCSGTVFNYLATSPNANTFTWTRAAVAGISNVAGSGNGPSISEQLINTRISPVFVTYSYILTNNNLNCPSNAQVVQVLINPVPVIPNQLVTSCNGNSFISSPTNVPNGTLYTWATPVTQTSGIILGGTSVVAPQLYISQALTNQGGLVSETTRYTVTPDANGCIGTNFFVDVTVNTTANSGAVLSNPTPAAICSGTTFNYIPASNTANTTFAWKRFYNTAISEAANSNFTPGNISEPLTDVTTQPVVVYYAYTLTTPNGCNNTQQVAVSVNPPAFLISTLSPVPICSNTLFSYLPISTTPGTSFSWTRPVVAGISNAAASGTGNPGETLINITAQPVTVDYNYFLSTPNGCINNQTVCV